MLDVRSAMDFSTRLMEALENARAPKGEGLVSDQRGPVPQEVAEAFRALMAAPEGAAAASALNGPQASAPTQSVQSTEEAAHLSSSEEPPAVDGIGNSSQTIDAPLPTPEELLQTQFAVNMHVFENTMTANTRDKFLSDFEQLLKASG